MKEKYIFIKMLWYEPTAKIHTRNLRIINKQNKVKYVFEYIM